MAVSGGQVIVDIVANTTSFNKGLAETEAGLVAFSTAGGRDASWAANLEKNRAKVKAIGGEARLAASGIQVAQSRLGTFDTVGGKHLDNLHAHARRTHFGFLGLTSGTILGGVGLVVAAQAFHHIQEHLRVTGDDAYKFSGRFRNAIGSLFTGDIIGAVGAFDAQKLTGSAAELQDLLKKGHGGLGDKIGDGKGFLGSFSPVITHDIDLVAALFGTDRERKRQLTRLKNVSDQYVLAIETARANALNALKNPSPVDLASALVFGERGAAFSDPTRIGIELGRGAFGGKVSEPKTPLAKTGHDLRGDGDTTTIHVHGVDDPAKVAHKIDSHRKKKKKSNPKSRRGRGGAANYQGSH